jgi:hypothetical protein
MVAKTVYANESGRYGTRMLAAGEGVLMTGPRARAAIALGRFSGQKPRKARPQLDHDHDSHPGGSLKQTGDDVAAARDAYQAKFGKRPFNGWDAATLRAKIAEA